MTIAGPLLGGATAYGSAQEHLREELSRVELLVRAQFARWEASRGPSPQAWGMSFIGVEEVQTYRQLPLAWSDTWPDPAEARKLVDQANALRAKIARRVAATSEALLRLPLLRQKLSLDDWAVDLVLFALLPEFDPRFRRLYGFLQNDVSRTRPTLELAWSVLRPVQAPVEQFWNWFSSAPEAPTLFQLPVTTSDSWWTQELVLEERVAQYLVGVDQPDRRVAACLAFHPRPTAAPGHLPATVLSQLDAAAKAGAHVFFLQGDSGCGQDETAALVAHSRASALLEVDTPHLLALAGSCETAIDRVYRESLLTGAAVYWRDAGPLAVHEDGRAWRRLIQTAMRAHAPSLFATPAGVDSFHRGPVISFTLPNAALRERLWADEIGANHSEITEQVAATWQLSHQQITAAARAARQEALQLGRPLNADDFFAAARRQQGQRLAGLARRFEPKPQLNLAAVVLPPRHRRQLEDFARRADCHRRHLVMGTQHSLIALFTGPSGTGKTLSAHAIASQQRVDLYRIDLAALVSKYVGETEKNLDRVFREAEGSNAILFFDEADAMFGRRGRIQQAQDRWANLEVNFLLQRVEDYPGIVVLATNLRDNIDEAFSRRIQVFVEFPAPDEAARLAIWQQLLPRHAIPAASLREIADRFPLAGGCILNAATDARCRAFSAGVPEVLVGHVITAIGREYQKADKPLNRSEFGDEFYAVIRKEILLED